VPRVTFQGIRDSVRVLLQVRMNRLALKFHETKDLKVRDEIYRLSRELIKLESRGVCGELKLGELMPETTH
jgi:hypothetical protein